MIEQSSEQITKFGSYVIKGDIISLGWHEGKKIFVSLKYNKTYNYFFLVKTFLSGKCHIDYFFTIIDEDFFSIENGKGNLRVGHVSLPNGFRFLDYNFDYESFMIISCDGENTYEMEIKAINVKRQ